MIHAELDAHEGTRWGRWRSCSAGSGVRSASAGGPARETEQRLWRFVEPFSIRGMAAAIVRRGLFVSCFAFLTLTGCARPESSATASILLLTGTGTSPNDVAAIAKILKGRDFDYATANSEQLNGMTESQLMAYRLIIVPGGNYITMGNSLTPESTRRIQNAVQRGVNYLGICAGAILAGKAKCNGVNLTAGVKFDFYAEVNRGIHKAAVPIACVNTPVIEHYWEDGPQFTRLGAGRRDVPGRNTGDRPRNIWRGIGDPLWSSS